MDNDTLAPPVPETTQEAPPPSTPAVAPLTEATTGAEAESPPAPPEEAAPEETTPPWSSLTDVYDVLTLEELKPHLEERDGRTEARLRQDFQGQLEQMTKDWETTNAHQTINGLVGRLTSKLDEGDFEGADRMLAKLQAFREPYTEPYQKLMRDQVSQASSKSFLALMEDALGPREAAALNKKATSGTAWPDLMKTFVGLVGEEREKKGYAGGLKENRDAAAERERLESRQGQGANLAPGSPAGGRSDSERLLDRNTPVSELREIRARQQASR
jgi:hypothetical protein